MEESEQSQTITEIRDRTNRFSHNWHSATAGCDEPQEHLDCVTLLEIVDSKAQRIIELEKQASINTAGSYMHQKIYADRIEWLEGMLAKQANEITALKRHASGNFEPEDFHNQILQDIDPLGQEFR